MKERTKDKKITDYAIAVVVILSITAIIYIVFMFYGKREVSIAANAENTKEKELSIAKKNQYELKKEEIDIDEIVKKNNRKLKKEEIIKKEMDLEYKTQYTENPEIPKGMLQVIQEGKDGKQETFIKKTYIGNKLIEEKQTKSIIIKSPSTKLVEIGTGRYKSNHKIEKGDDIYITPILLAIRINPNENAEKLISLNKNTKVQLIEQQKQWYKVQYQTYIGWAKAECFTYLNNEVEENNDSSNIFNKNQLLNKLSFNMKLNKPSGLTLEQFKKIFSNETKDKKNVFENNAQYFYYAEKQYNVNGVFLAAVAIHESGWGGSSIANDKKNLFGYGAYDSNPYNSAYDFSNYSEGIDLLARVFIKYYLNPKGSKIYDGNIADGCYYNGPTLSGVNVKYATDKNWANGVYSWMKYLYNRI